jgi:hypothetical protein
MYDYMCPVTGTVCRSDMHGYVFVVCLPVVIELTVKLQTFFTTEINTFCGDHVGSSVSKLVSGCEPLDKFALHSALEGSFTANF